MKTYDDVIFFSSPEKAANNPNLYFRIIHVPTAGLIIGFRISGFAHTAYTECDLSRLDHIHQYGWLENSQHTRMNHLFLTYAFTKYLMIEGKIPEEELPTLYFAALTHDVTTPAFGDRVKHIAPDELDEEKTYTSWIEKKNVRKFIKKYGINADACKKAVEGKNRIGEIIDWSDKIAYTYFDIAQLKERHPNLFTAITRKIDLYRHNFKTPVIYNLTPGNILEKAFHLHTTITNQGNGNIGSNCEQTFICFAIVRAAFLEVACLTSPTTGVYGFYGSTVVPILIENRMLDIEKLLAITDQDLAQKLAEYLEVQSIPVDTNHFIGQWWYKTEEEAQKKIDEEMEYPNRFAWMQSSIRYGNVCTSPIYKLRVIQNGIAETIRDIRLRLPFIRKIEEYQEKKFHVISVGNFNFKKEVIEKLRNALKK